MRIDHIGYVVSDMEKAKKTFEGLGYVFENTILDDNRNINICFGEKDGYRIELVEPMNGGSAVDSTLSKIGPTPYHICYCSSDIELDIERLKNLRFKIVIPPAPAIAFSDRRVVFLYSLSIGLVEIVEE